MRTKTLLLIGAAVAASIATSNAQVYSVNAVGYVNKVVPKNSLALLANPLKASPDNKIKTILAGHDGLLVYVWNTTKKSFDFGSYSTDFGWDPEAIGDVVIDPGHGLFVKNADKNNDITITFVGEVPQGKDPNPLSTPIIAGLQIVGSQVPQAGTIETLGYKASEGDAVYQWNLAKQNYDYAQYSADFGWDPPLKTLDVGDGVFLAAVKAGSWTRSFSVND